MNTSVSTLTSKSCSMKPIFELISHLIFYALLPLILIVYGLVLVLLFAGHAFAHIFDWADARRSRIINKLLFPLSKR